MPLFLDLHRLNAGVTPEGLARDHLKDLEAQSEYEVRYLRYWFNQDTNRVFCLVRAPSVEAANAVHIKALGSAADDIMEVEETLVEELLGSAQEVSAWTPQSPGPPPAESPFRTILFTDMESSTALTQRLGDAGLVELLRTHDSIIRDALSAMRGREIKHTGDGIMACFESVARGVECAIAIQRGFAAHNEGMPQETIRVRIGLSAGEPLEEQRDLFGAAVQLAARICRRADPEGILVSNVVRELCIGKEFRFTERGDFLPKGFDEPVRVYEVPWRQ